jgi:hypothetical protein
MLARWVLFAAGGIGKPVVFRHKGDSLVPSRPTVSEKSWTRWVIRLNYGVRQFVQHDFQIRLPI